MYVSKVLIYIAHYQKISNVYYMVHLLVILPSCYAFRMLLLTFLYTTSLNVPPTRIFLIYTGFPLNIHINFNIATLTYKMLATRQPGYLHYLLNAYQPIPSLHSQDNYLLPKPSVYIHINRSSCFQIRCSTNPECHTSEYLHLTISQFTQTLF